MDLTRKLSERSSRVEFRIARFFLTLSDGAGRSAIIAVPLSRQEIADMVGTTQETAIRIMSRWSKSGILVSEGSGFRILDRGRLEAVPPTD